MKKLEQSKSITYDLYPKIRSIYILNYDFKEYKQIGKAKRVIIEDMKQTGAYPVAADTNEPRSAGPKPIVASQKMKNVDIAYDRRCSETFLVMIAVLAELSVPNPRAAHIAQIITVTFDG